MGDCKCGRIPPCYSGKIPRVAPLSEETAQETIKILECFSKSLEAELKACELMNLICEDIEKQIKSDDMEKKKMTKAGAFEWLKHKKVALVGDSYDVQIKLFNIGYKWCDGSIVAIPMVDFLFIDDETFQFTYSLSHFKNCAYEEISSDDILSIEIVEEKKEKFVDCSVPCDEIKAVQELLRNSKHLKDKTLVITKDNAAIL